MRLISFICAFLLLAGIPVGAAPAEEVRLTVSRPIPRPRRTFTAVLCLPRKLHGVPKIPPSLRWLTGW